MEDTRGRPRSMVFGRGEECVPGAWGLPADVAVRWGLGGARWGVRGGGCSQCAQRGSVPSQESLQLGNIYRSVFANTLKGA